MTRRFSTPIHWIRPNQDNLIDRNPDNNVDSNPDDMIDSNHDEQYDYVDCRGLIGGPGGERQPLLVYRYAGQVD